MTAERASEDIRSIARFQITKPQYLFAFIGLAAILSLGVSSIFESQWTVERSKVLSAVETPAASIIFTQRETLVYATRLAQWSNGGTTRRQVQIARNLLAQRLAVIDTSGRSMGSRAKDAYWHALKKSDAIVAAAPMGILPESLHREINTAVSPVIDEILAEARNLVVSYQRSIDQEMLDTAARTAERDRLNLLFFYIFIASSGLFLFLNVRTNFKNYRRAREALKVEQIRLDDTIAELLRAQSTVVELQDLNAAKNAFISTVNHELRTPLTSIIGYLDIIKDEKLDQSTPELANYLSVLERNAEILLRLVESMLSLSKIDAAEGKLIRHRVSINETIDNAIFIMKPAYEKASISVEFNSSEQLFVDGDSGQLNQVLINLLGNAIKFSPSGSSIEIALKKIADESEKEFAQISITDHGIGIPQEDFEHLFTRFFRAKNADSGQYPGTGLGLSIVQQVINLHGGEISFESEIGKGTTFFIKLPLALTSEEKMILERRAGVLDRAITALEGATEETMKDVTHEIGGAIGFYGFLDQGREILNYSRTLEAGPLETSRLAEDKLLLLTILKIEAERISGESNG